MVASVSMATLSAAKRLLSVASHIGWRSLLVAHHSDLAPVIQASIATAEITVGSITTSSGPYVRFTSCTSRKGSRAPVLWRQCNLRKIAGHNNTMMLFERNPDARAPPWRTSRSFGYPQHQCSTVTGMEESFGRHQVVHF